MWLSVFFGGIWQFVCNIFSWKNKTPFWRVIWAIITVGIVAFTCMLGYHLAYYINEFDKEGNQKQAVDNMLKYSANNYYGLMTKTGIPVTAPLYSDIEVVTPGVYQCHIPETAECIMVNSKGIKLNN